MRKRLVALSKGRHPWLFLLLPLVFSSAAVLNAATTTTNAPDEATPNKTPTVLELHNGDFVRGQLLGIADEKLTWQCPFMTETLEFKLDHVSGIVTKPHEGKYERGEFAVELSNGRDQLFGDLRSIDAEFVSLESPTLGSVELKRSKISRIWRVDRVGESYALPTRLTDWIRSSNEDWTSKRGVITSVRSGATLFADVKLPNQVQIEFELLYETNDNSAFAIAFGTRQDPESLEKAFSIETWGREIVAQRRNRTVGDVVTLETMKSGNAHFLVYLDRDRGQMLVYSKQGEKLGEFIVGADKPAEHGNGITIVSRKGTLQLKRLRMSGWSGAAPRNDGGADITVTINGEIQRATDVRLSDGSLTIASFAEDEPSETENEADTNSEYKIAQLSRLDFQTSNTPSGKTVVIGNDGTQLTGTITSADEASLSLQIAASVEPVRVAVDDLRSLHFTEPSPKPAKNALPKDHRRGTLELMDTRLSGWLVESDQEVDGNQESASCLIWQAESSEAPSRLRRDVFGRIVYEPLTPSVAPNVRANRGLNAVNLPAFRGGRPNVKRMPKYSNLKLAGTAVHLRSGDTIPCSITSIGETGVRIESKLTKTKDIPHELIKAAQLDSRVAMPFLEDKKRERFLTLPRMHRDLPPQHLLFSKKGDILRGSIVAMSNDELSLELRLDSHRLPRHRVSAIVWLHEDEIEGTKATDDPAESSGDEIAETATENASAKEAAPQPATNGDVQVVGENGGSRFTFYADSFSDQTIYGKSDILKDVHAAVTDIDQLLLGPFIQRAARTLPYHRWRLTSARDPKFVTAGDEGSGELAPGAASSLVGQPAPEITLPSLDGEPFRLSDHRGHCVVLDFWATWCGPCIKIMPQVESVVAEFDEQDVRLFAVNLEESAEQIQATLERRDLRVNVVLDRDGVAANRYEATAIPQTVVVAPDGTIARVFVGSSRDFQQQLRAAIKEVTETDAE